MVFAWPRPGKRTTRACSRSAASGPRGSAWPCSARSRRATTPPRSRSTRCSPTTACASASRPSTARSRAGCPRAASSTRSHTTAERRATACAATAITTTSSARAATASSSSATASSTPGSPSLAAQHGFALRRTRSRSPAAAQLPGGRHRYVARASAIPQAIRGLIVLGLRGYPRARKWCVSCSGSASSGSSPSASSGAPSSQAAIGAQLVVATSWPAAFAFDPGGRIFYGNRFTGQIRIFNPATGGDTLFFDPPGRGYGRGARATRARPPPVLPGEAVHIRVLHAHRRRPAREPDRAADRFDGDGFGEVDGDRGDGQGFRTLLSLPAAGNHNGGVIHFGLDNELYAVVGDVGNRANAQDLSSFAGKVLRISGFSKPLPANLSACSRVCAFAFGIRNSFGFTFDPQTGNVWQTENGPECNDELNRIVKDGNHAWGPSATCSGTPPPEHEPGRTLTSNPAALHLQSGHRPDWSGLLPRVRSGSGDGRTSSLRRLEPRRDPRCNTDRGPARGGVADQ